jgi:hypothetical protein
MAQAHAIADCMSVNCLARERSKIFIWQWRRRDISSTLTKDFKFPSHSQTALLKIIFSLYRAVQVPGKVQSRVWTISDKQTTIIWASSWCALDNTLYWWSLTVTIETSQRNCSFCVRLYLCFKGSVLWPDCRTIILLIFLQDRLMIVKKWSKTCD